MAGYRTRKNKAKKSDKRKARHIKRRTHKGGIKKLGPCYISELPNNNLRLTLGRRRYKTKFFSLDPSAKELIKNIASNMETRHKCIAIAKMEDHRIFTRRKATRREKQLAKYGPNYGRRRY